MMSDIESEVKWRMGRLYNERLGLRDLIDDKPDLEVAKKSLLSELDDRNKIIQELNKHKSNETLLREKDRLTELTAKRNKFIQELNKHKNDEKLLKKKDKLSKSLDVMKYNKTLHTIEAGNIISELKTIQDQLYPPILTTKISDLDYVQVELKTIQEQLTPISLTTKIGKTNHISTELNDTQTRLDMAQGTYRHVTIPGEYALEQQKTCHGRDSYPREGFLFDFMINNNIDTQLIIGGERSFGFNGVLFSQARTIGDDQVILYPDHNLYPTPAVDFLLNKNFNQTIESVPFEDKPDIAVWRGGDTGGQGPVPGQVELGLDKVKINRQHFVNKFKNTKCIDAAIIDSEIGPSTPEIKGDPNWLMPHEQANNYKYIISLEGNDAGSNPRWVFSTQCVVFMSDKLTSELTWHYHLKPWVNYIPFKHDLSDLENKIKWANDNIDDCKSIIKRANEIHRQVTDVNREYKILTIMLDIYKNNIK